MKRKLICDFDDCLAMTSQSMLMSINSLVKEPHLKANPLTPVTKWDYSDIYPPQYTRFVDMMFRSKLLFHNLSLYDNAYNVLTDLHDKGIEIIICSIGTPKNIKLKIDWIKTNLPFCDFIPIIQQGELKMDKSIINMSNCVFVDDHINNVSSSSADLSILYKYENVDTDWNQGWGGEIATSWTDEKFLQLLYRELGVEYGRN